MVSALVGSVGHDDSRTVARSHRMQLAALVVGVQEIPVKTIMFG
jgi:hypothetical protein